MKTLKSQKTIGFVILGIILLAGLLGFFTDATAFPRLLIGIGIGYVLSRGVFGFAGMANRTFRTGSAGLIKGMMLVIIFTSIAVGAILIAQDRIGTTIISLSTFPITWGLFLGGLMFGIGMAFSSCCATGVLQELVSDPLRAVITIVFFGTGVFIGFPIGSTDLAKSAIIGSDDGISLLSIIPNDVTLSVIVALLITFTLAIIVILLSNLYEKKTASKFPTVEITEQPTYNTLYEKLFIKPYTMIQTTLSLSLLIALIFLIRGKGWSASSVIGYWLASFISLFGVSPETLNEYAGKTTVINVLQDPSSLQNIGIIIGTIVALLLASQYVSKVKTTFSRKPLELVLFALGGLLMGLGTRLSLGCNVGAFLTPAVGFSVSGWVYFVVLIASGYLGNKLFKQFYKLLKK
jgi:uncharacterized membrane protein YedE/YeeE